MATTATNLRNLEHRSTGLTTPTPKIRPYFFIDNYKPYYPDPHYDFHPYWYFYVYNQHHLYFYNNFAKPEQKLELDVPEIDQTVNPCFTKAQFDQWQAYTDTSHQQVHNELTHETDNNGPQFSLTNAVGARFVNSLVTRNAKHDYVPLTTNLGLKCKRQKP